MRIRPRPRRVRIFKLRREVSRLRQERFITRVRLHETYAHEKRLKDAVAHIVRAGFWCRVRYLFRGYGSLVARVRDSAWYGGGAL